MIARIVTGSGRTRQSFDLPCSNNRKEHVTARIGVGNKIKQALWPKGKGFKAAQARGAQRAAQYAGATA
ncbi:hypothetical protein SPS_8 [Sphingomonas phage Scott]|uniref:Uncharacterized protein n=1 Tax=Sphingomonas phage Scott TaxID=2282912 RepID=A0A346FDA5_9CAUD|nr:hypothetical protein HOT83_gp08 [Sphingomonas phage Scott]AXN53719.1 hypothetical protein SPS_8 [Sphingomonas phage Scott]